ncbi:MAG TPA: MFS transporter [Kribbellaceae bacterium]
MSRLAEYAVPARLGRPFRSLLASSWISNIGDGIALAAGPLLVASQTHDPMLVALAGLLQRLPWLVFGLFAGAIADRLDRRLIVVTADLLRAVVLVLLAATVVTGTVNIAIVLVAMVLLGTAETFADNTSHTLMPMLVEKADYGVANARLMAGFITANQLAGPPIGAALFAAGMFVPFVTQAVCVALGALLVSRIAFPPHAGETAARQHVRRDIAQGFGWLWSNPPVRTLALTIVTFNVTFGAAWSVLVLYAIERLRMGEVGFGLLTTAGAVGGIVATASYGWLEKRVSLARLMRACLITETFTHLVLALTTTSWVALGTFFLFGVEAFVWGTTSQSVRQRAVPTEFQGRVGSVYMLGVVGGMIAGGGIGGAIARQWGVTAPFWFAFVGSALILALIWRELANIAHADDATRDETADQPA